MGRWVPCRSGWEGLCCEGGAWGGGFATTSCLCESPAFLFCCCQRDSSALRPQALSKLCRITPSLVLRGKDKCSNGREDNGNLIHQHKSIQASLPKESYPDVLAGPDHCTVPITHCAARDCLLPLSESRRLHGHTPLPDSTSRLGCSIPENLAGRSKVQGGAGNRACLTALRSPLDPHASIYHLLPSGRTQSPGTIPPPCCLRKRAESSERVLLSQHPHTEGSAQIQTLPGSSGFKRNCLHLCLP